MKPAVENSNPPVDAQKIRITRIKTISGHIDCPPEATPQEMAGHRFGFETDIALNNDDKVVGIRLVAHIEGINEQEQSIGIKASYTHEMVIRVDNLEDFIILQDGNATLTRQLIAELLSIAYSTIRGIIFHRTQGTSLGAVILPVIPPLELIQTPG